MRYSDGRVAGTLLFVAATQMVLALIVSEALYPGYSTSLNYISDLGVGPSAVYFNTSIVLLGLLILGAVYFLHRAFNYTVLTVFLVLAAVGAIGVGVFTEDFPTIHPIVSLITFLFGGLSAIFSAICSHTHDFQLLKPPFSILSVILGVFGLAALALFGAGVHLGLGVGGMERMIAYPMLLWGVGVGGYLIAFPEERKP
jgi:hypothetical membrane protein